MAISVTTDLVDVSSCDATTSGGQWYRIAGTSSANPAADLDAQVQNSGCIANKMGSTTAADVGAHFNSTATFSLSANHLFYWRQLVTPGALSTKANQGVQIGLTSDSLTGTSWAPTNFKRWNIDGSDTIPITPGWLPYCMDPNQTHDFTGGTLNLAAVKNIGFLCRQNSSVTTTVSNQFIDAVRYGSGLTLTCSSGADTPSFASIYDTDNVITNRWGLLTKLAGIYYGQGVFTLGSASQANACNITDTSGVFVWRKNKVANAFQKFNLIGNSATNKTTLDLTGWVLRGQESQKWSIICGANSDVKLTNCSVSDLNTATLSAGSILSGASFSTCGQIDLNGGTISNGSSFKDCTASSQILCSQPAEAGYISASFTKGSGTTHAIEIQGTAANVTLNSVNFSGYASSDGSTGNEAVYVNIASGSMNLTVNGGTTPSVRTAGATVTVISGAVAATAKAVTESGAAIASAIVHLEATGAGPFPVAASVTISNAGTTATVTHTAHGLSTNDKVVIRAASLDANNGVFTITKIGVNSYSYTMASAPGSNPTGSITSTFVVLNGNTDGNGEITMSRVFPSDQPVTGRIRKGSSAPYYKQAALTGTVTSASGGYFTGVMISDD